MPVKCKICGAELIGDRRCCPLCGTGFDSALEQEDYERLKWRVLRAFGVLPGEARARRMTDREYLYCAAQMMLDEREKLDAMCPSCRERAQRRLCPVCGEEMPEENAGFDERRFEELRDAGVCETASSGADETCGAV